MLSDSGTEDDDNDVRIISNPSAAPAPTVGVGAGSGSNGGAFQNMDFRATPQNRIYMGRGSIMHPQAAVPASQLAAAVPWNCSECTFLHDGKRAAFLVVGVRPLFNQHCKNSRCLKFISACLMYEYRTLDSCICSLMLLCYCNHP